MFSLVPWKSKNRGGELTERGLWSPAPMWRDFDALFNRALDDWFAWPDATFDFERGWGWNLDDRGDEFVVQAAAPGFEPEDFDVQISGNCLTIAAERKEEDEEEGQGSAHRYSSFRRSMTLPEGVKADNVQARYHSGILEVRVPKAEHTKGKRITVEAK
jgi:HSP20 family protein